MKFSLILATLGRDIEVEKFVLALMEQSYKEYELIIIDQNNDDRIKNIYQNYKNDLKIIYLHINQKGLSHARNIGLAYATGDIIAFPDDDCWYSSGLLEKVKDYLDSSAIDGICGCPIDENNKSLISNFLKKETLLCKTNVWHGGISFTIFLKSKIVKEVGLFDEMLGVGAGTPYGSGEETDYLLRALEKRFKIIYTPEIKVFHPRKDIIITPNECKRAKSYGRGMGAVLKKHHYSYIYLINVLIRPLGGAFLAFFSWNIPLFRYRFNTFLGRVWGLIYK
ncbi:glycosyltransferase family 2 protein [Megasphaera sp.]|uniref:glycosyltransferase family 2 protein n=1 Tax=Megasphaera sp. TaxID=2023260 RepID=UPI0035224C8B